MKVGMRQALSVKRKIVRNCKIPYLAGSSNDNRRTYIDSSLPLKVWIGDWYGDIAPFLNCHEQTEWEAMHEEGMPYLKAHFKRATPAERKMVEAAGIDWLDYQKVCNIYVKKCGRELYKHIDCPDDLDEKPYDARERADLTKDGEIEDKKIGKRNADANG